MPRFSLPVRVAWLGAWVSVVALSLWMARLSMLWIGIAAVGSLLWLLGRRAHAPWWSYGAAVSLWAATALAFGVQLRLGDLGRNWSAVRAQVEETAADAIGEALDDLVDRGELAVDGVARIANAVPPHHPGPEVFARLEALRRETGMSALVIYAPDGTPIAWSGEHRGSVPSSVRRGEHEYSFHRGPLFGYLYFAHPIAEGRVAVASLLLESSVHSTLSATPFSERFAARQGVVPRFLPPERAEGEAVWDWTTDRPILSVTFDHFTQEAWHSRTANRGRWAVAAAWLLAIVLLSVGWYRRSLGPPGIPVAVVTVAVFLLPLRSLLEAGGLFSPLHFVLAGPGDLTLGQLLILVGGAAVWLLVRTPSALQRPWLGWGVRMLLVAALVPAVLELVRRSASLGLLAGEPAGGFPLVFFTALLIAVPAHLLLFRPVQTRSQGEGAALMVMGIAVAAALSLAVVLLWTPERPIPVWVGALWALPFALMCLGRARDPRRLGMWSAWLLAGWLGGTASASYLWTRHMDARIDAAETELTQLGTEPVPYLDYLLRQFAERSLALAAEGESGVNLLYRAWVASGLAGEGYEARLTLWVGREPEAELRFSDLQFTEETVDTILTRAHAADDPVLHLYAEREEMHYLLLVPLPDQRAISVATPPRRRLGRATALAQFLHPEEVGPVRDDYETLSLVPVPATAAPEEHLSLDRVRWVPTRAGWRSEATVQYPSGLAHAHLVVAAPSTWMLLVRGLLVQLAILVLFLVLWALARTLCGEPLGFSAARWGWIRTFRGRLTLALFGFFLLPTVVFGLVAYRTLSQQAVQTGAALALRSLALAAPEVPEQSLRELGVRVRSDLLLYRDGGLIGASVPEVLDLGLFQTWLPPSVELAFSLGEETEATEQRSLAGNRYLVAYRRVGEGGVLAAPIPLASGEIARVQREFAHGFLLMMIAGAALSVVLALLVGRALSRPIELLSRATAAVGGGNLRLRLPEDRLDEFGGAYRAFNRMVRRLRRARADEVRTARVLAWGQMARQVAHEIKNPLTPIKLSVQHLRRAYADGRPDFDRILDRNVEAILREIDRLSEIARAFARFGTPQEEAGSLEPVDLRRVLDETLVLYRGGKDAIRYETELPDDLPRVLAREGELREVLLNVLENAREAVDGDGAIRITADTAGGGGWVRFEIADNGVGIPAESLPRIFEPQFSTRTSGTGLGLAIVRRLVESWGAQISASSEPGAGTTIHLRLRADGAGDGGALELRNASVPRHD